MTDQIEKKLSTFLAVPVRPVDEVFVKRLERLAVAEKLIQASENASRRRFAREVAGLAAVLAASYLLWTYAPPMSDDDAVSLFSPAFVGLIVVALWIWASLGRPLPGEPYAT